jgi:hypothetical protein
MKSFTINVNDSTCEPTLVAILNQITRDIDDKIAANAAYEKRQETHSLHNAKILDVTEKSEARLLLLLEESKKQTEAMERIALALERISRDGV